MPDEKSPFEIRQMQAGDIASVLEIEIQANPNPWSEGQFQAELTNSCSRIDLLITDNKVAAYICSWHIVDELQIQNVATAPTCRRQGWAAILLEHLLVRAAKEDVARAFLEVRVSNVAARTLYEKFGFLSRGVRKKYYADNEDALLMELELIR